MKKALLLAMVLVITLSSFSFAGWKFWKKGAAAPVVATANMNCADVKACDKACQEKCAKECAKDKKACEKCCAKECKKEMKKCEKCTDKKMCADCEKKCQEAKKECAGEAKHGKKHPKK